MRKHICRENIEIKFREKVKTVNERKNSRMIYIMKKESICEGQNDHKITTYLLIFWWSEKECTRDGLYRHYIAMV